MQLKQNMSIIGKDDNISENFGFYEDEKLILKEQDIKKYHANLIYKSSDTKNYVKDSLLRRTP